MTKSRRTGLARSLSKMGFCSRSQGFLLVRAGRIAVNGVVRRDPEYPVGHSDSVTMDDRPVEAPANIYLMMNKPRGLVTTASDEQGRATVYSLLPPELPWIAPVGRLDKATEGLLLFTNDSELAAGITAPESHVMKTYHVQIDTIADETLGARLIAGVREGGARLRVRRATVLRTGRRNSWLEIALDEGKNRHIRRMLSALGIAVLRLVRVAIGPLQLGQLPKGSVRRLSKEEINELNRSARASEDGKKAKHPRRHESG